jgi:hypothetical protein
MKEYRIGGITQSGLRVASERSTISLELAKATYHTYLFAHPPPPPADPALYYHPRRLSFK